MAVNNTLQRNNKFDMAETKFDVNGVEVKLSPNTVRKYLETLQTRKHCSLSNCAKHKN